MFIFAKNIFEKRKIYIKFIATMTEQQINYIEIGRGAKLVAKKYWHQFILGIDLRESVNFLVVSEVEENEVLYKSKISIEEIKKSTWKELIKISKTKDFIDKLIKISENKQELFDEINTIVKNIQHTTKLLNQNWISKDEYNNLGYNSNFSNWIDATYTKGKLKFILNLDSLEEENCHIKIPIQHFSGESGYFSIQMGRFELSKNQILIWQNDIFPSQIKYELIDNELILELYKNKIKFVPETLI
ncbi:MAG: hypothetical protein EAZ85_00585 [Bacteroidetes bacterium]|nr:MAG: hypothetical protein EAZ85_00585 [Bacteroidota bacterium]TAG85600.1 MAG: hypothetical protein EAZ20_14685 [Bacteroidota bacterium]